MRKPITIAPLLLIAALSLTIALAGRMKERAAHDRFSFHDFRHDPRPRKLSCIIMAS